MRRRRLIIERHIMEKKELFRVAIYDQAGKIIDTEDPDEFYTGAHMSAKYYDDDYPQKEAHVQHSLDGGKTWADYDAHQTINGVPAWVHHLEIWQAANGA
jgi:hypothetical protein